MINLTMIRLKFRNWFSPKALIRKAVLPSVLTLCVVGAKGQPASVLTYKYDNARTGNDPEIGFGDVWPGNLDSTHFGKLYSRPVNGAIYAQPLYMPGLTIPGKGWHNVVFVATEGDSVYAFDADKNLGDNAGPLWAVSLIDTEHGAAAGATTVSPSDIGGCDNISPQIGITSTPVIDSSTGTMYVEAASKEGGGIVHRLHALDITTGQEKLNGPRTITITVGDLSQNLNSAGLLLSLGTIYMVYGPPCSVYQTVWVLRYNAASLLQEEVESVSTYTTANWMTGAALAADANGLVFPQDLGSLGNGAVLLVPDQISAMNIGIWPLNHTTDFGYGDPIVEIFWFDRDCAIAKGSIVPCGGHVDEGKTPVKCDDKNCLASTAAYGNGTLYYWTVGRQLRAFNYQKNPVIEARASTGLAALSAPQISITKSFSSLCPHGVCGIVWALRTDAYEANGSAVLQAYDATDLTLLYSSDDPSIGMRDDPGAVVRFAVPTAISGAIYVGTQDRLSVYGLFPPLVICTKDPPCLCTDSCGPTPPVKCPPHKACR